MTDDIAELYRVAKDSEVSTLDDLVIRAGLAWECKHCGWRNPDTESICEECRGRR
jgi:hypothetical protein